MVWKLTATIINNNNNNIVKRSEQQQPGPVIFNPVLFVCVCE